MTTPPPQPDAAPLPPLWLRLWGALLPAAYVLSPLALLALPRLRALPRPALWVLGFYALSQQLPALLAPDPLRASGLALARTALMLGLIAAGAALGPTRRLGLMGVGLGAVYVTAVGLGVVQGHDLLAQRLIHPYMTSITLGLTGAAGIWISLFASGRVIWRVPLGVAALGVLLLSGSRGPLAAALVGCALGFAVRQGPRVAVGLLAGAALLGGAFYAGQRLHVPAIERLQTTDTSGRDIIWNTALSVIRSAPLGGVGSYLLGDRLAPPGGVCTLWPTPEGAAPCPAWLARVGHPWLIAHNVTLQQLAETGPLGLLGLFLVLGVVASAAWLQRDALGVAILSGLLVATANDNTLLVPGPFVGELCWITAGCVLARLPAASPALGWAGGSAAAGLLLALSLPVFASALQPRPMLTGGLSTLIAPRTVSDVRPYRAYARFVLGPGRYRAVLRACTASCVPLATQPLLVVAGQEPPVLTLEGTLFRARRQRLELQLYPGQADLRSQPLAQTAWTVEWRP